jgi:hypothetical protein
MSFRRIRKYALLDNSLPFSVGIDNIKGAEFPLKGLRRLADMRNPGGGRPVMTPINQLPDAFFRAFSDHFDRTFPPVPDPPSNP